MMRSKEKTKTWTKETSQVAFVVFSKEALDSLAVVKQYQFSNSCSICLPDEACKLKKTMRTWRSSQEKMKTKICMKMDL